MCDTALQPSLHLFGTGDTVANSGVDRGAEHDPSTTSAGEETIVPDLIDWDSSSDSDDDDLPGVWADS